MKIKQGLIVVFGCIVLAACATDAGPREQVGTIVGAGLGAWIGSEIGGHGTGQVVGAAVGTLIGAELGRTIGRDLDEADRQRMGDAHQQALERTPTGRTVAWTNPDSGNSGTVTPRQTYDADSARPCRDFESTVIVDGREEKAIGRACRNADGSWEIVS